MPRALDPATSGAIVAAVTQAGYRYVSLDLQGYRQGSLNEALRLRPVS
jgi:PP-loop superfamily ATP-utilizing enzyme